MGEFQSIKSMILEVRNIAKSFLKRQVLNDVSFTMRPNELSGIVGENGAGKSTLLKIIVGILKADHGQVLINGQIGYCPQSALLFDQLTVNEHFEYFSAAYGMHKNKLKVRKDELLKHFCFEDYQYEKIANLSGGTEQKLNLAIALLHQPKLLILDEPYNGFDWDTYQRFWDCAQKLRNNGCAILVIAHLINETGRFDHIYDLKNGILE